MRNANKFCLRAVDGVAQDPAAGGAMRIHLLAAIDAFSAGANAGDQNMIARLKYCDGGTDLIDNTDAFMAQNTAGLATWQIPFEDVKIGATNRRFGDLDDCVRRRRDFGPRAVYQSFLANSLIDKRLHGWRFAMR